MTLHDKALLLVCIGLALVSFVCFMCWWLPRYAAEGYQSERDNRFHYGKEPGE